MATPSWVDKKNIIELILITPFPPVQCAGEVWSVPRPGTPTCMDTALHYTLHTTNKTLHSTLKILHKTLYTAHNSQYTTLNTTHNTQHTTLQCIGALNRSHPLQCALYSCAQVEVQRLLVHAVCREVLVNSVHFKYAVNNAVSVYRLQ